MTTSGNCATVEEHIDRSAQRIRRLMSQLRSELQIETAAIDPPGQKNAILVWPFHEAPEEFQKLSDNGGDEDWIAFQPWTSHAWLNWAESGTPFGVCEVSKYETEHGTVYIGCHA